MSVTVSNYNSICNNPLNRSKSKSLYSFPKNERFKAEKNYYCDKLYELPTTKSKRFTSLGYSNKYDFTKGLEKSPAPNKYLMKSDIEK